MVGHLERSATICAPGQNNNLWGKVVMWPPATSQRWL